MKRTFNTKYQHKQKFEKQQSYKSMTELTGFISRTSKIKRMLQEGNIAKVFRDYNNTVYIDEAYSISMDNQLSTFEKYQRINQALVEARKTAMSIMTPPAPESAPAPAPADKVEPNSLNDTKQVS